MMFKFVDIGKWEWQLSWDTTAKEQFWLYWKYVSPSASTFLPVYISPEAFTTFAQQLICSFI